MLFWIELLKFDTLYFDTFVKWLLTSNQFFLNHTVLLIPGHQTLILCTYTLSWVTRYQFISNFMLIEKKVKTIVLKFCYLVDFYLYSAFFQTLHNIKSSSSLVNISNTHKASYLLWNRTTAEIPRARIRNPRSVPQFEIVLRNLKKGS